MKEIENGKREYTWNIVVMQSNCSSLLLKFAKGLGWFMYNIQ